MPLKVEGTRLVGTAQSQEEKRAVSVNLVRRSLAKGTYTFEGTVTSGSHTEKVQSTDNTEMSEEEVTERYLTDTADRGFTRRFYRGMARNRWWSRVGRTGLVGFLDAIRDQNVRSRVQRSRHLMPRAAVGTLHRADRRRTRARQRSSCQVEDRTRGDVWASSRIRRTCSAPFCFPSAGWRDAAGKLDHDKLAAAVAAAMAKAMAATVSSTSWENVLGDLTIELKRPDETVAGLKLNSSDDRHGDRCAGVAFVQSAIHPVDRGCYGAHGRRASCASSGVLGDPIRGQRGGPVERTGRQRQLCRRRSRSALKGVTWDSDKEQWAQ